MRLFEITAQSFRNLSPEPVFFGAGVTLVTGENAQGKTNLLEAVAVLCGQRSFRRVRPQEIAAGQEIGHPWQTGQTGQPGHVELTGRVEEPGRTGPTGAAGPTEAADSQERESRAASSGGDRFAVAGRLERGGAEETLRVAWSRGEGRSFARGEKQISFREVARLAPAVFLSPEHRELLTGGPALRRRFLDRLVLASRPAAGDDLVRYERALTERNALLARGGVRPAAGELDAWTEELVRSGVAVRRHRCAALAEWRTHFTPLADAAGPEYAAIQVDYSYEGETEEDLRSQFERLSSVERRRGHSMAGPHRDDLVFRRHGRPLAGQASAGELHRAVSLVKLAEWRAVEQATGEPPLLGVDEFDAGLSAAWTEAFLKSLPQAATVILTSAADPARWRRFACGVLEMRGGRVVDRPRAVNAG